MSRAVKELLRKELARRFTGVDSLAVVALKGLDAVTTRDVRARLREKHIRVMVVKNSIARQAFGDLGLDAALELIDGPCAVAFGEDGCDVGVVTIVREMLDIQGTSPALTVKGALLEGEVFGPDRVEELSMFPTREEAVAKLVACMLGPAGRLAGAAIGPGGRLAAAIKAIEDKADNPENATGAA